MTITETRSRTETATRAMLACGVVAGPLFVATAIVQTLTPVGLDLRPHPITLLSVGEHGWIQVTNFIVAGVLSIIFSLGVGRVLTDDAGSRWAPRFFAVRRQTYDRRHLRADPALGFPAGTHEGYPEHTTTYGLLHAIAPPLSSFH